jgi:hypothetical protein
LLLNSEEIAGVNITGNGYATGGMVDAPDVHALSRHAWWRNPDDYRVRYIDETRVVYNADTGDLHPQLQKKYAVIVGGVESGNEIRSLIQLLPKGLLMVYLEMQMGTVILMKMLIVSSSI